MSSSLCCAVDWGSEMLERKLNISEVHAEFEMSMLLQYAGAVFVRMSEPEASWSESCA